MSPAAPATDSKLWAPWALGDILGEVEARDVASAKAAAAVRFDLDEIQRNRIMVQELG